MSQLNYLDKLLDGVEVEWKPLIAHDPKDKESDGDHPCGYRSFNNPSHDYSPLGRGVLSSSSFGFSSAA